VHSPATGYPRFAIFIDTELDISREPIAVGIGYAVTGVCAVFGPFSVGVGTRRVDGLARVRFGVGRGLFRSRPDIGVFNSVGV
jgi:hypothetical protein